MPASSEHRRAEARRLSIGARYDAAMLRLTSRVVVAPVCVLVSLLAPDPVDAQVIVLALE